MPGNIDESFILTPALNYTKTWHKKYTSNTSYTTCREPQTHLIS